MEKQARYHCTPGDSIRPTLFLAHEERRGPNAGKETTGLIGLYDMFNLYDIPTYNNGSNWSENKTRVENKVIRYDFT